MDKSDELRDRVEARKHELLAKYNELKADTRKEALEARTRLKASLDELEAHLKVGWAKVSDEVRTKLNQWLDRKDQDNHAHK
jgi:predicted nucleotidyltransferase